MFLKSLPLFFILILFSSYASGQNDPFKAISEMKKARKAFDDSNTFYINGFYDKSLEAGHKSLNHVLKAENLLQDAPFGAKDFTPILWKARATNSLGIIYQSIEDISNAINYLDEASSLYQKLEINRETAFLQSFFWDLESIINREMAFVHTNFGMVHLQVEEFDKAIEKFKDAKILFGKLLEEKPNVIDSLYLFGLNQFFIGYSKAMINNDAKILKEASQQMVDAISFYEKNLELIVERDTTKFRFATIVLQAAKLELEEDIFEDKSILRYLNKSIALYENSNRKKHSDLGKLYAFKALMLLKSEKDLDKIKYCLEKSWEILAKEEDQNSIRNKLEKREISIKENRDILFGLSNRAKTNFEIYQKFKQKKYLEEAYEDILLSVKLMDNLITNYSDDNNLEIFLNRYAHFYRLAAFIGYEYYSINKNPNAFDILFYLSEKQKGYILRKAINRNLILQGLTHLEEQIFLEGDSLLKSLKIIDFTYDSMKERGKTKGVSIYRNKRREAQSKYEKWLADLESNNQKLFDLLHSNKVTDKKYIKEKIVKDKAALVEFILTKDKIITLLKTAEVDTAFSIMRTSETNQKLELYYQSLAESLKSDNYRSTAFDIYQYLFKDVDDILTQQKIERVYLVPDDILHTISFNAMLTGTAEDVLYKSLPYLLNKYKFSRHFSATTMLQNEITENPNQEISFGGFVADYEMYPKGESSCGNLGLLKNELTATAEMKKNFKKGDLFSYATLEVFENNLNNYDILHLSMHGCINSNNPNFSSLVFTYENSAVENELKLGTLYNKTFTSELVVLSACDTGGGKLRKGEGLISFGRAFMYAGCKSVVMSLWAANNDASHKVMESFYSNLSQKKMTKDEALTEALRKFVRSESRHPSNWANFIIMGNLNQLSLD